MSSMTTVENFGGAVGWVVDRTGIHGEIICATWLVSDNVAVTCANLLIPFFDSPNALVVKIPGSSRVYGVEEIKVHNGYDPWMAKRNLQEVQLFPALGMANQAFNLAALTLRDTPAPMNRSVEEKVKAYARHLPSSDSALSGKASRLQITSIIQTLLNAHNQGTLTLFDKRNLPFARFFIKDMKVSHIEYKNLRNEDALFRLLTGDDEQFSFLFMQEYGPDWINFPPVEKGTTFLLMNAFTRLEDSHKMMEEMGGPEAVAFQKAENLDVEGVEPEDQPALACVWNHIKYPLSLSRLIDACRFDGATLLKAVRHLAATGQAAVSLPEEQEIEPPSALTPANVISLERGSEIISLGADPGNSRKVIESGYVLDQMPAIGEGYFVHSLGLPQTAVGSPLLLNGEVIGIHCGLLVNGAEPYMDWFHPGLMISVEAVYQCIDFGHGISTSEILTYQSVAAEKRRQRNTHTFPESSGTLQIPPHASQTGMEGIDPDGPNQAETMRLMRDDIQPASDSQDIAPDYTSDPQLESPEPQQSNYIVKSDKRASGFFATLKGMFGGKGDQGNEAIEFSLLRQGLDSERFEKTDPEKLLRIGDVVRLRLRTLLEQHIVVLFRPHGETSVRLIYPPSTTNEEPIEKGAILEVPAQYTDSRGAVRRKVYQGIPINTEEEVDVLLVLTQQDPIIVGLFELGIEDCFNAFSDQLITGKAFETGKFKVENGEITRVPASAASTADLIRACRVELRHGR